MAIQGPPTQIQIEVDDATSQGAYVNMAIVSHTDTEFIFDFVFIPPQTPKAKVRSRIITSPAHAKRFLGARQENLQRYEGKCGAIRIAGEADKQTEHYEGHYL